MENKFIAKKLQLLAHLMELHQENSFKIRTITAAAFLVDKYPLVLAQQDSDQLAQLKGIGKSLALKITELIATGEMSELQEYIEKTPIGIIEMLGIKGIGPKKITTIWKDLGIESVGELYYACNENRLIEAKGFGVKTQEGIKKAIEFKIAANGKFLYARIENFATDLVTDLQKKYPNALISLTGAFRRKCEIIEVLELVMGTHETLDSIKLDHLDFNSTNHFELHTEEGLHIKIHLCDSKDFYPLLFKTTATEAHLALLNIQDQALIGANEFEIYQHLGCDFIPEELREGFKEVAWAKAHQLPNLIQYEDLKGSLHNHSTWSDGVHSLKEMALYCKNELQLSYLGICDHSKAAFYANGLSEERVLAQHQEIETLNSSLAPFKIFKGIESDILNDGSLDYSDAILKQFDFVVASVHSNLKMDLAKATERLIKAIENPYTTILGHPTGRLLLSRNGYPIDYEKVIDACAANGVVIEINANPLRLDLDWRWHQYALEKGVLLAINPDAHRTTGFLDMKYGTYIARKGGLSKENCLNSLTLSEITTFFNKKKSNHA